MGAGFPFESGYRNKKVLLTGLTGFKGSWLGLWLAQIGARVTGLSLAPEAGRKNLYEAADIASVADSRIGDIRDRKLVNDLFQESAPEIVFHLAAQPLVQEGYRDPVGTFETNVLGTINILDAARFQPSVRAIVCVTSDKVYDNKGWVWRYRENDALGGKDPYSASKAAAEIVAASYASAFYSKDDRVRLVTARGGNVVGGGDWAPDRIVPDLVRAIESGSQLVLRNPGAIRPWQHVLELCRGYLLLGQLLLAANKNAFGALNFGPNAENEITVLTLAKQFSAKLRRERRQHRRSGACLCRGAIPETGQHKSRHGLRLAAHAWHPRYNSLDRDLVPQAAR